ncbi:TPA: Holliday junction resolvase RecU [Clostridium perfringens]
MTETKNNKTKNKKSVSHVNRGLDLEKIVSKQCEKYIKQGKGYIFKLHTEFIVRRGTGGKVIGCVPKTKSLTDFFGVLTTGEAIAIEVKNTNNKTSFPLSNIKNHQFIFLAEWNKYTPHSYYIIRFKVHNEIYLVHSSKIQEYKDLNTRKSIPYNWFKENANLLDGCDFLKPLKTIIV